MKVANAISDYDTRFRERARLCLAHAGDATWTPEKETLTDADHVVPWTCLPAHGGFKVARGGKSGERRVTCDAEKVAQSHVFAKFKKWAAEACGVTEAELRGYLEAASALPQARRGLEGIPMCMRRPKTTVRHHAMLLCRTAGLRKAVAISALAEIGATSFTARAAEELERILALRDNEVMQERKDIRRELWRKESFDWDERTSYSSCAWVVALLRVWLHREGAALMVASAKWRDMLCTRPTAALTAPHVISLDGAQWVLGVQKLHRIPALLHAWWLLIWQSVCLEVSERYGELLRIRCRDPVTNAVVHCTFPEMYLKLHVPPT